MGFGLGKEVFLSLRHRRLLQATDDGVLALSLSLSFFLLSGWCSGSSEDGRGQEEDDDHAVAL